MANKRDRNKTEEKPPPPPPPPQTWKERWLTPNIIVSVVLFLLAAAGSSVILIWGVYSENWENRIITKFKATEEFKKIAEIEKAVNATNNTLTGMNERLKALERTAFPKEIKVAENAGIKDPQLAWVSTTGRSQFASTFVNAQQGRRLEVTHYVDQADGDDIVVSALYKLFRGEKLLEEGQQKPRKIPVGKSEVFVYKLTVDSKTTILDIRVANIGRSQGKLLVASGQSGDVTSG